MQIATKPKTLSDNGACKPKALVVIDFGNGEVKALIRHSGATKFKRIAFPSHVAQTEQSNSDCLRILNGKALTTYLVGEPAASIPISHTGRSESGKADNAKLLLLHTLRQAFGTEQTIHCNVIFTSPSNKTYGTDISEQIAPEDWYGRYGRRIEDYRLPSKPAERIDYAQQVGEDGDYLLKCLADSKIATEGKALKTVKALEELWPYHYEYNDKEDSPSLRWKSDKKLTKKTPTIESPYDTDVRYRRRCGTTWTGYITHLSETCDDDSCHLITHVMTTDASVHEAQCVDDIHQALIDKHLRPKEHFADTAYVNAFLLVNAQNQGIEMVGPARFDTSWQARTEGAFDLEHFEIDWENEQVSCPQGKTSQAWKAYNRDSGKPYILTRFHAQDCADCPVRSLCTKAKPTVGRTLHLLPQAEHEALEKARHTNDNRRSEALPSPCWH